MQTQFAGGQRFERERMVHRLLCFLCCVGARLNLFHGLCVIHRHGSTRIDNNDNSSSSIESIQFGMRRAFKLKRNMDQRIGFAVDDNHAS